MIDRKYKVYRHTTPSGKMYVGITSKKNVRRRWRQGAGYKCNIHFTNAINKYGWDNIEHEILLDGLTREEAELAEKLFIGYWDLTNRDKGYNVSQGGNIMSEETRHKIAEAHTGFRHTDEAKQKISMANRGRTRSEETKRKLSEQLSGKRNPNYGKRWSEEEKAKMSEARKGVPLKDDHRQNIIKATAKRVVQLDWSTEEVIAIYESTREAERMTGVRHGNISACCKGNVKTAGGYLWIYYNDEG